MSARERRDAVLDNPIWESLHGRHAGLALRAERAARYPAEVGPLAGLADDSDAALADLASLVEPGGFVAVLAAEKPRPELGFEEIDRLELIQMVCEAPVELAEPQPTSLTVDDVPAMLELTEATQPGPFGPRTLEMGSYVGFREGGRLVAMGGERMRPPGLTEVSAICTAADSRGCGMAESIVRRLVTDIHARGEVAFLHVWAGSPSEASAVGVYSRVGFRERARRELAILRRV